MTDRNLRLGYHTHIPALKKEGKIYMPGHIGFFIDALAKNCKEIICFQHKPLKRELIEMDYKISSENVKLENIGPHSKVPYRVLYSILNRNIFRKKTELLDAIIVRSPTPLLSLLKNRFKNPFVLYVVQDPEIDTHTIKQNFFKKKLIMFLVKLNYKTLIDLAKNSLMLVNSKVIYNKLKDKAVYIKEIHTTTLRKKDFFFRRDTCLSETIKILYAGRIIKEKGLFELFYAFLELNKIGYNISLNFVGPLEKGDNTLKEVIKIAEQNGIKEKVFYYGYKSAGEELLNIYHDSDIFVCPSLIQQETYPRTLREAMASSLPVVATQVGSLPFYISDASILVPPGDVGALTRAIENLITNSDLRQKLIQKGFELVQKETVENKAKELVDLISEWLSKRINYE